MRFIKKTIAALLISSALLSCSDKESEPKQKALDLPRAQSFISNLASLREQLPQDALAYLRLPSPWGFVSAPKGNVFDDALANKAHVEAITKIQKSLNENILNLTGSAYDALSLLMYQLDAPIELAVLKPAAPNPAMLSFLMRSQAKYDSVELFNAALLNIADNSNRSMVLLAPQKEDAPGHLKAGMLNLFYQFDAKTGRLNVLAGMSVHVEMFAETMAQLKPQKSHPMYEIESEIDGSKRGLFAWVNGLELKPMLAQFVSPHQEPALASLLDTPYLALGWGTVNGKDRLRIVTDLSNWSAKGLLPDANNELSTYASGKPSVLAGLNFPSYAQVEKIEKELQSLLAPQEWSEYEQAKLDLAELAGISIEQVLSALGSELLVFSDKHGEFASLKIRDAQLAKQLLAKLVEKFKLKHSTKTLHGRIFHHLSFNWQQFAQADNNRLAEKKDLETQLKESWTASHLFWIEDGDYWTFSSLPQLLMDRVREEEQVELSSWLAEEQKQDLSDSFAYMSLAIEGTPKMTYQLYLSTMLYLADLSGADFDIYALPSAQDLNLPSLGSYGAQVDYAKGKLALSLSFENNPLEFVLAGQNSMGSIAALGILAAVAVPAYQDYIERSRYPF